jgi:hypothetical protein
MTPPDLPTVRDWISVPAAVLSDAQLQAVLDAEVAAQANLCTIDAATEYPDLEQALLRRVGRAVAARSLPTGLVGVSDFGVARLPALDSEIERYERAHRTQVLA